MMPDDSVFEQEPENEDFDDYPFYQKAGKLAHDVREKSKKWIKAGASVLEIAEKIEAEIGPEHIGFPVNISINENAAHYTPEYDDKTILQENDVVCVDIGTHFEGFVGDTAYSVDLGGDNKLVEASAKALENALSILKSGINTRDIGAEIERTIKEYGFKPVENLGGHGLEQYEIHAYYNIPNVKTSSGDILEEGEIFAIEPFATTGSGRVKEGLLTSIFSVEQEIPVRNKIGREILDFSIENYKMLPFAERWLMRKWKPFEARLALRELISREALKGYPVLHDIKGSKVSQAEVTVCLEKDSCEVLT